MGGRTIGDRSLTVEGRAGGECGRGSFQDGPDNADTSAAEKCRFAESQPKIEFGQAIAAAEKTITAANRNF